MTKIVGLEDIKSSGELQQELQQGGHTRSFSFRDADITKTWLIK